MDEKELKKTSQKSPLNGKDSPPLDLGEMEKSILEALEYSDDFSKNEKDNIKSSLIAERQENFKNKLQILETEWKDAQLKLSGMRTAKLPKEEIKEQETFVKRCYDTYRNFKSDKQLDVPDELYELLEIEKCSKVQKTWLLHYCHNQGNAIEACSKANVSLKMYRKWKRDTEDDEANKLFKEAVEEIDQAYLEIAEMNLKALSASKNVAAIIFFLKNRHDAYKATNKLMMDEKKARGGKALDYNSVTAEDKKMKFLTTLNIVTENEKGENEVKDF